MRIAFTFENTLPATAADAEVFLNTAAALARRGHEAVLVAPQPAHVGAGFEELVRREHQLSGPLEFHPLQSASRNIGLQHLKHANMLANSAVARDADVVYTRNMVVALRCLAAGHRVFFDHYRPWGDQFPPLQLMIRQMFAHPGFVGMVSHSAVAKDAYVRIGAPDEAIRVVHNGYSPERMSPVLEQSEARAQLGIADDAKLVVYTGRINQRKGLDTVLDLARSLPDATFMLVGSEGHGLIEHAAEDIPNVKIIPWQPSAATARYLYAADVLIIPPSASPMLEYGNTVLPLKIFLYLAAGRAIYAPASPDVCEVLVHDENACLVATDGAPTEADSLGALLADEARMRRLGRAARELSEALTWDARAERIEAFLAERILAAPTSLDPRWSRGQWLRETAGWLREGVLRGRWVSATRYRAAC